MGNELSFFFNINKVFILGAGFSYPAGMPLTKDLLPLLHYRASDPQLISNKGKLIYNYSSNYLLDKLQYYYPLSKLSHKRISSGKCNINIEEFMTFLATESAYLPTSEWLSEHGSKFITFCKQWIGEIIFERQQNAMNNMPQFYSEFVAKLENALVLTFNWDTILENIFDELKKPYRYQLNVNKYSDRDKSIPILKLHGSIDWVTKHKNKFYYKDWMKFESLGNSFKNIQKIKGNLPHYYNNWLYPWIVLPSYDKLAYLNKFGEIWEFPSRYFNDNLEVVFIGFSFRKDDFHARTFIYPKLVHESNLGNLRVKVVDFATDDKSKKVIVKRFNGIKDCNFWFDGFNKESLDFIFK